MWRWTSMTAALVLATSDIAGGAEFFVGRWASNPTLCRGASESIAAMPMVVTEHSLHRSAESCRIGKMYKVGSAVFIEAHCAAGSKMRTIPIKLESRGGRLGVTWNGGQVEEMERCP